MSDTALLEEAHYRARVAAPLAELEIYHSRPIAPTRRVAVGRLSLPVEPAPGPGGLLLAGVVARFLPDVDVDFHADYQHLLMQLQRGERIPQPRLRHRLQQDLIGLTRSCHRLERRGGTLAFVFQVNRGAPEQYVLAAAYAAGALPCGVRLPVMNLIRKAEKWRGPVDGRLIAHLTSQTAGFASEDLGDPVGWALGTLGFDMVTIDRPPRDAIVQRFRHLLRVAHPDTSMEHRGDPAQRIADLTEARRILMNS